MSKRHCLLAAACVGVMASMSFAQTITSLVKRGQAVPGVGNVTTIDDIAVNNDGSWLVNADTDAVTTEDWVWIRDGALYMREDESLADPEGTRVSSSGNMQLSNSGNIAWNLFLRGNVTTSTDSGIFFNKNIVVQEGKFSSAPEFSPNTPYIGFFGTKMNAANTQMMVMASVDDPAIATTVDRALVRYNINPANGQLFSESVFMKEGDIPAGQTEAITDFRTSKQNWAFNAGGDVMWGADLTGDTNTDGVIYINNTLIAQEGSPSPVAGRNWGAAGLGSPRMDMNSSGGYVHTGTLDAPTTSDLVIIRNGEKLVQEGDSVPGAPGFIFTGFGSGPVDIDDQNNVLWFGAWDGPAGSNNGLFLNHDLLVQTGVTEIDGLVVTTLRGVTDGYALSDNGQWIIFEAILSGGVDGAFMIAVPEPGSIGLLSAAGLSLLLRRRRSA
jgi:hypothetical protein